jgi:DNA-binding winged helix-turn-helix (wHTH) protein/tetratricopeptide (TPR) repeat protein
MVESGSAPSSPASLSRAFAFGNLCLDSGGTLSRGDKIIHLPPKELAALQLLLAHAGHIVSAQQLKKALWPEVHVSDDSVSKCLSSLREFLTPDDYIQTVYKRGYRLVAEIRNIGTHADEKLPRLVIVPFATEMNVAPYLGASVAEETIALLAADPLSPIRILARDSAFSLAARGMHAHKVGEMLQADLTLTGTLRSLASHFRLRVEMIRVADGTQIWVEDMLVPQDRAAGLELELAHRLFVRLGTGDPLQSRPLSLASSRADRPGYREAYELFLLGHHEWQSLQRNRMQEGIEHLSRAIEHDPALYEAHIDLANATVMQILCGFAVPAQAAEQVRKILEAIPVSVEGAEAILPAMGWVRFHVDHDLVGALRDFSASSHLPHETSITRLRTMFALSRHRFSEAITLLNDALQSDPYSPWLNARLAWAFHLAGESAKSAAQAEHALEIFPDHVCTNLYGSMILAFNGNSHRALAVSENLVRRLPHFDPATGVYGYALAQSGRLDEARSVLERLQWLSRERFVLGSVTAVICAALGDTEGALAELKTAAASRCPWFFQALADPRFASLHHRPEFASMRAILDQMEKTAQKKGASTLGFS